MVDDNYINNHPMYFKSYNFIVLTKEFAYTSLHGVCMCVYLVCVNEHIHVIFFL